MFPECAWLLRKRCSLSRQSVLLRSKAHPRALRRLSGRLVSAWSMTGSEARVLFSTTLQSALRLVPALYLPSLGVLDLEKVATVAEADRTIAPATATISASPELTTAEQPPMQMQHLAVVEFRWSPKMARKFSPKISAYPPIWSAASSVEAVLRSAKFEKAPVPASPLPKHHTMKLESVCSRSWAVNRQMKKRCISFTRTLKPKRCAAANNHKNRGSPIRLTFSVPSTHSTNLQAPQHLRSLNCRKFFLNMLHGPT